MSSIITYLSRAERLAKVERGGELSPRRQCGLLGIGRASLYRPGGGATGLEQLLQQQEGTGRNINFNERPSTSGILRPIS